MIMFLLTLSSNLLGNMCFSLLPSQLLKAKIFLIITSIPQKFLFQSMSKTINQQDFHRLSKLGLIPLNLAKHVAFLMYQFTKYFICTSAKAIISGFSIIKKHGEGCEAQSYLEGFLCLKFVHLQKQETTSRRIIMSSMSKCRYHKLHMTKRIFYRQFKSKGRYKKLYMT